MWNPYVIRIEVPYIYLYIYILMCECTNHDISSTVKVSDGCIRDLGFNPCLYQKLIGVLV